MKQLHGAGMGGFAIAFGVALVGVFRPCSVVAVEQVVPSVGYVRQEWVPLVETPPETTSSQGSSSLASNSLASTSPAAWRSQCRSGDGQPADLRPPGYGRDDWLTARELEPVATRPRSRAVQRARRGPAGRGHRAGHGPDEGDPPLSPRGCVPSARRRRARTRTARRGAAVSTARHAAARTGRGR